MHNGSLRETCPYSELFWFVFSRIQNTLKFRECEKIGTRITPNTDNFWVVDPHMYSYVYFWANLFPMKFLTLAHYIIICQRYTIWCKAKTNIYIYIYIYTYIFFRENMGGGEWGMVEHKIFFCNMSLFLSRWNTFCWHETLFYAKSTCFFCIRLFFV